MEDQEKNQKMSLESFQETVGKDGKQEDKVERQDCPVPQHLSEIQEISRIFQRNTELLEESGKFKWCQEFKISINVQVMETNFESMRVMLHYGNLKMQVSVIYTEIEEAAISQTNSRSGSFGLVRFLRFEKHEYAVKAIRFEYSNGDIDTETAYQEYFMCAVADVLGFGPKIFPLFGYDILITKKMVFFAMEKCSPTQLQFPQSIESELRENLKIMNSFRFIHGDIKPQNVAYSDSLEKHVFIDFGLSRFIKQAPGHKTKTKFRGTLNYCSDEMKKCYFFSMTKFIDLYENDLVSFRKTILALQQLFKVMNLLKENTLSQEEENDQQSILSGIVAILRLKYFVETSNLSQILKSVQRKKSMKRVFYELLKNSEVPKFISENEEIKQKLKQIKAQIIGKEYKKDSIYRIFCEFFCEEKRMVALEKIIPISQILQSKPEFFNRYLVKPELTLKLFYFFQPFWKTNVELKKAIVQKIYQTNPEKTTEPVFFSQKLRYTLQYFYQNVKNLKNVQSLLSLRLLFAMIDDWINFKRVQNFIVEVIQHSFLKMLKILEFNLLRSFVLKYWEEERNLEWGKALSNVSIDSSSLRESKLLSLHKLVIRKPSYEDQPLEFKLTTLRLIKQIGQLCFSEEQRKSIFNIQYFFIFLCRLQASTFLEPPKDLEYKVYARFFVSMNIQAKNSEETDEQEVLFLPMKREIESLSKNKDTKPLINSLIQNQFLLSKKRKRPVASLIQSYIHLGMVGKKYLYFFIEKMKQEFSNLQLSQCFQTDVKILTFSFFLELMTLNQREAAGEEKIGAQEKLFLVKQLSLVFNTFINNQQVVKLVKQFKFLQAQVKIIQVKLGFQVGKSSDEMRQQIQKIAQMLQPLPCRYLSLAINFLTIFSYLKPDLLKEKHHYSKPILFHIFNEYARNMEFQIFQHKQTVQLFLTIKNQEGNQQQSLQFILALVQYYRSSYRKSIGVGVRLTQMVLLGAVDVFGRTLGGGKVVDVYGKIKDKKLELQCGFYGYFVTSIFMLAKSHISQAVQLRQVIRSTLCLKNMLPLYQLITKSHLAKLYKHIIRFKSKRKALVNLRLQIRITASPSQLKALARQLNNRSNKFVRKNIQPILQKFKQRTNMISLLVTRV